MLVQLFEYLQQYYTGFNVFGYLTLRGILAVLTALILCLVTGPFMICRFNKYRMGQSIRDDGPQSHLVKEGTPTMGGLFILFSVLLTTLLWSDLSNRYVWIVCSCTLGFGVIGAIDDIKKLIHSNSAGLSARYKYALQSLVALLISWSIFHNAELAAETNFYLPLFKNIVIDLGPWLILLSYFVIVGSSNAVNLTDGLDGLAIMPTTLVAGALGIFAYLSGHADFAQYLVIPHIPLAAELVIFCAALVGAGLGFLWFNTYPAQVFMGDVGALALGAALGVVAVLVRQEIVLFIMGGVFVVETVSVMMQVASFKLTGKRIFRMAPLHHHFELNGWPEPRVIVRFWIITVILVLIGLATLKIR